jgi:drug/metabolite transporter (DMT)-like permease
VRRSDIAELFLLAALWGGSFLFMRIASPVLGPIWLIEIRVLLGGLALLPLLRLDQWEFVRRHARPLFTLGVLNSAIPFVLISYASLSLPAGFTAILNATTPLFGTLIAFFWLKEQLTPPRLLGFLLGFVGVVVLVGWQPATLTPNFVLAVGAGLIASLMYAIAAPYAQQRLAEVPSLAIATISHLGAAAFLLPALPFTVPTTVPSKTVLLSVLLLALASTSLAYILYFRLIRNIGSTNALTVTYLVPLFAIFWGSLILQEPLTLSMGVGGGLILAGIAIAYAQTPK